MDDSGTLRLDFVSPLPPVRSGIADYARDLLAALAGLCDLRLVRLPGQPVAAEIASRWPPVAAGETAGGGRLPLYQMGNNRYHEAVLELALERPGILTLHDLVLHHLLLDRTLGRGDFEGYRSALAADHGWVGEAVAGARRWGAWGEAAVFALPARRRLLRRQRGVLVHSPWAERRIREEEPEVRVAAVPMAIPLPPVPGAERSRELRRRLGIPEAVPLLGSFGFQTPIKRPGVAVAALARPELAGAHLLIAGEVSPALDLGAEARRAGVAARLRAPGFLEPDDFGAAVAACDVCLNLRYPSAGETSASLLRVLAWGRPTLVSDYAQFAELPDGVVAKVPLGAGEVEAAAAAAAALLGSPEARRAMGEAAREHVRRRHDPAAAARAVAGACREWGGAEPPGEGAARVPRATSLTWGRISGRLEVTGAGAPWPEGERRPLRILLENWGFARWLAAHRGPGGVGVEVGLLAGGRDLRAGRSWLPLPRDVAPGEAVELRVEVRRPPGAARLRVEPHVVGGGGFGELGGPVWESAI